MRFSPRIGQPADPSRDHRSRSMRIRRNGPLYGVVTQGFLRRVNHQNQNRDHGQKSQSGQNPDPGDLPIRFLR